MALEIPSGSGATAPDFNDCARDFAAVALSKHCCRKGSMR